MKVPFVLILSLSLCGCATGYNQSGLMGGYSDIQLNADTFQISSNGNAYTSSERAANIALLRASELMVSHGFDRFVIVTGSSQVVNTGTDPVIVNRVGNTVVATGGDAIMKPRSSLIVRGIRPSDPAFASALDAKLIFNQLRPQFSQS
jgi:hypothetical protein